MPTGAYVYVSKSRVEIHPSTTDFDNTLGLCGKFDANACNDFHLPDGSTVPGTDNPCNDPVPANLSVFLESWRYVHGNI